MGNDETISQHRLLKISEIQWVKKFDDSTFKMVFPPGTHVFDKIAGIDYKAGTIMDVHVDKFAYEKEGLPTELMLNAESGLKPADSKKHISLPSTLPAQTNVIVSSETKNDNTFPAMKWIIIGTAGFICAIMILLVRYIKRRRSIRMR